LLKVGDWTREMPGTVPGEAYVLLEVVQEADQRAAIWCCVEGRMVRNGFLTVTRKDQPRSIEEGTAPALPDVMSRVLDDLREGVRQQLRSEVDFKSRQMLATLKVGDWTRALAGAPAGEVWGVVRILTRSGWRRGVVWYCPEHDILSFSAPDSRPTPIEAGPASEAFEVDAERLDRFEQGIWESGTLE